MLVSQAWQSLAGFSAPFAYPTPAMTQPSKQFPNRQTLFMHALPQEPQFALSKSRSAHGAVVEQHACRGPQGVPVHEPPWHASPVVQALLSSHTVPFATGTSTHWPVAGLHVNVPVSHAVGRPVGQTTILVGFPQTPFWQVSPDVHALPSSHAVPFAAVTPTQAPFWQLSPVVHELPSLHAVPFVTGTPTHWPVVGSHVDAPVSHWVGKGFGGQMTGTPTQVPLWHASPPAFVAVVARGAIRGDRVGALAR
jgi:hypothetical protein